MAQPLSFLQPGTRPDARAWFFKAVNAVAAFFLLEVVLVADGIDWTRERYVRWKRLMLLRLIRSAMRLDRSLPEEVGVPSLLVRVRLSFGHWVEQYTMRTDYDLYKRLIQGKKGPDHPQVA